MAMYEIGFGREAKRPTRDTTSTDYESDDLAPARGVLVAIIFSAMLWAIIIGVWCSIA
jgi:hypothetical protein